MEFIRCLQATEQSDIALVGGKAANLGILARADLPVPPGFVILTSAHREFLIANGIQITIEELAERINPLKPDSIEQASQSMRLLIEQGTMPNELADSIFAAYAQIGDGAVAVRSSATAEDLPDASFAGQQESYLNIDGSEQVLAAVKRCWSSLWTARALAYEYWFTIVPPDVIGPDGQPVVEEEKEETVLEGIAVSGGRTRGIARIVLDPREAARLHAGEILVTQATDPGWTPIFPLVSGLVLEIGGQLSHGAIVAREYGIPAVLNVQGAMRRIRDGQIITVDGNRGKVFMDG